MSSVRKNTVRNVLCSIGSTKSSPPPGWKTNLLPAPWTTVDLIRPTSAKRIDSFSRKCVLALRGNIARHFKGMDHHDFCMCLADSPLLQWFLQIGRIDKVKIYAKSSSDRFARWIDPVGLQAINNRLLLVC
jgi:hypothetical protein